MSSTARHTDAIAGDSLAGARSQPRSRRHAWAEGVSPYLFVAPFVVSFVVLFVGPAIYSLVLSFYRYRGYGEATWVGTQNYDRLLNYHQFWTAWRNTIIYWLGSATLTLVTAFLLAVLVYSRAIKGKRAYKPIIFMPHVIATVAAALVFQTIFAPESGVLNNLLNASLAWDQDPVLGKIAVILLRSWHSVGWFFVIFLAGLTTINPELYDAAKVDGANAWQSLRSITLPLMRRTVLFAVVTMSIYSLRMFAEPNLLFPNNLAPPEFQPIMSQLYQNMRGGQFGMSSAVAWLIFVPVVIVSVVQFRLLRGDDGA